MANNVPVFAMPNNLIKENYVNFDLNIIQFAIIILPGYLSRRLANSLSRSTVDEKTNSEIRELLNVVVFSIISINLSDFLIEIVNNYFDRYIPKIYANLILQDYVDFQSVLVLVVVSIFIGIMTSICVENRVLYKVADFLKLSSNHSNESAWQHFNKVNRGEWVTVKDFDINISYVGYIEKYEIDGEDKIIVLSKVTVYEMDSGNKKYETKSILLKCNKDSVILEVD